MSFDRESDAGVARCRFHHKAAGPEIAAFLGFENHPFAGAIFHRLARVHEFGLAQNGAAGFLGCALELDERRMADRFDDVVVNFHGRKSCWLLSDLAMTLERGRGKWKRLCIAWKQAPAIRRSSFA
jgi:hypothetical protein